jgi:hypothetical protein
MEITRAIAAVGNAAEWVDKQTGTEWGHHSRTNESTCALLCHYHHSLTHQPGWSVTGNAHRAEATGQLEFA